MDLFPRGVGPLLREVLASTRVTYLAGPRQAGKSTLVEKLVEGIPTAVLYTLDDPGTLLAARTDPITFLEHDGLLVVDEIQRAPELLLPLKAAVDRDKRPGRFLVTGSADVFSSARALDTLAGRLDTVQLNVLSRGEQEGHPVSVVDDLFDRGWWAAQDHDMTRDQYLECVVEGGYPEAVRRTGAGLRGRFFDAYVRSAVVPDAADIASVEERSRLGSLLSVVAAQTGGLLVVDHLARDTGLSRPTASKYLAVLEALHLVIRLPSWSTSATLRVVATPKVYVSDSGLASHLRGAGLTTLRDDVVRSGPYVETFAVTEILRQLAWSENRVRPFFFRTKDGVEVDLVLEHADGRVVAVEIKASRTVGGGDTKGLAHLRERLGQRFVLGLVAYLGHQDLPLGDRLRAVPMAGLWRR